MHIAVPAIGLLGTNGIVGGGLPIAAGAAFGMQTQRRDDVTVCFFGEGATGAGTFGEALNIAALWRLPLVFVCENNQYVELTSQDVHVAGEIWRRGESHGIPGARVDGNDVDAMSDAMAGAVARARTGEGPTLLEGLTYRWFGHYAGDRAAYRSEEEVSEWRSRDPVLRARATLPADVADRLDAEVEDEIAAALAYAQESPVATADSLAADHYAAA
jgi:TPP-dependent pyruvate/acetoin dehydrogenase alpha subunit